MGFNGQLREMQTSWYLLGNGYRAYNPRLMRFHSPDSWSPFNGGRLNAYMYCVGDPVNRSDPTGHFSLTNFIFGTMRFFSGDPGYHASGGGRGLLEIGAAIGSRAPNPGGISSTPIGNSPGLGDHAPTTLKHHPGFAQGAAMDGLTAMGSGKTRFVGGRFPVGSGRPRGSGRGPSRPQSLITIWEGPEYHPRIETLTLLTSAPGNSSFTTTHLPQLTPDPVHWNSPSLHQPPSPANSNYYPSPPGSPAGPSRWSSDDSFRSRSSRSSFGSSNSSNSSIRSS
ncbi:RHS repeat-associated core domain-containing protein [Pseudomonas sp. N3-W]|uniref:RHS repeat-associated core domain-containing protein n=1 Tax=Pseudomonas fungipugnans TaxID=3024217 RepID=A0ABT6QQ93_9PSED|nr:MULTISPECIES: RHS repeat-associated core domain-containing protein [unclassified Pseudomonas]MDI2593064.1 RHS repeat-associated core domain-containing protein [Pseudomonas sp. 681]UWF52180.1 RHS repeat-associated core domain-containing protein [Pseudomonas sp. N3-W]